MSVDPLEGIRRLRGVSWTWKQDVPGHKAGERDSGVIAQEVRAVWPELTDQDARGYLMVDYGGLGLRLAEAGVALGDRALALEPSDGELKDERRDLISGLMDELREQGGAAAEGALSDERLTQVIGALTELVKELDRRLVALERSA